MSWPLPGGDTRRSRVQIPAGPPQTLQRGSYPNIIASTLQGITLGGRLLPGHFEQIGVSGEKGVLLVRGVPAVYIEHDDSFVISDIHLGYEEVMAGTGVYLPRLQLRKTIGLLERLATLKPGSRLVINGDLKHCFQKLTRQERIEIAKLVRKALELGFREVIVVRGNHDNYAKAVLAPLGIEMLEEAYDAGKGVLVAHGHKKIEEDFELLVMGHEHPALQVSVGGGRAKFPLFLEMPLENGSHVLILPPAGVYQVGNIVSTDRSGYLSPIIRESGIPEEALPVVIDSDGDMMPLVSLGLVEELMLS